MNIAVLEMLLIGLCLAFLFFLSLVEAALTQSGPLALKLLAEREDAPRIPLLGLVADDAMQLLMPIHFGTQLATISIAVLATHLSLSRWPRWGVLAAFAVITAISLVFRQLLPRLLTQNHPESKAMRLLRLFGPLHAVLWSAARPLSWLLGLSRSLQEASVAAPQSAPGEPTGQEIQAYLEIGEDEGIIEEEDSRLIQSVVEFGDTLVRDVMTPRTKIVACAEEATIGQLRDIMVQHRHSRIPIYRGDIDHIVGIAYIRQLLARYAPGREADPVAGIIHPALFVPETKPVSALLREMQQHGDQAAIVIDEFGGVSGLVTMEDLLEEIVGEIRDEDQAAVSEIAEDGPQAYIVRGGCPLERLQEVLGRRFEGYDCSTAAGLVTAFLGRVPAPGEEFDIEGVRFRILDADRKRVLRIRIGPPPAPGQGAGERGAKGAAREKT